MPAEVGSFLTFIVFVVCVAVVSSDLEGFIMSSEAVAETAFLNTRVDRAFSVTGARVLDNLPASLSDMLLK